MMLERVKSAILLVLVFFGLNRKAKNGIGVVDVLGECEYASHPTLETALQPALVAAEPHRRNAASTDDRGEFYFRESILDQLDKYFMYIKRMKSADRCAYDLYSKVGAHIVPPAGLRRSDDPLSSWWKKNRPSFGAVAYGIDRAAEEYENTNKQFIPKFMYFTKYDRPPSRVQPTNVGDVYVLTVYWDKIGNKKFRSGSPTEFPVVVSQGGEVRVLKTLLNESVSINSRTKKRGEARTFQIPQRRWGISKFFREFAEHNTDQPVEEFLRQLFIDAANRYETANYSMIMVRVISGADNAVFAVDVKRTPYFFKDRDIVLGEHGKRRKIFHIVRPHKRKLASGRELYIKFHFRGSRGFDWNGYRVEITVPVREHFSFLEFDVPALGDEGEGRPNVVGASGLAKRILESRTKSLAHKGISFH